MAVTVEEVMTWQVISVREDTCFKEVAAKLFEHGVTTVPVLDAGGGVAGVVSEADLLRTEEFRGGLAPTDSHVTWRAAGTSAGDLMSAPAITVTPETSVTVAARVMNACGIKSLPVVTADGRLLGIVSRHDVLKVFVRSDEDLERQIRVEVLNRALWMDTTRVHVAVVDGVVTLSGRMCLRRDAVIAVWMTRQVNGVVDVIDEIDCDRDPD
ncbi:CBS domain-containing protein [Herbidospora yilanensis]|uniref:CBS domain-containing protein n=1 Tax=Herbidospora yilanensis TaxID=354426 RepID=UPI000781A368|nr:CBS domain-containing protein [Herbidospora yilanensis]